MKEGELSLFALRKTLAGLDPNVHKCTCKGSPIESSAFRRGQSVGQSEAHILWLLLDRDAVCCLEWAR